MCGFCLWCVAIACVSPAVSRRRHHRRLQSLHRCSYIASLITHPRL